MRLVQIVVVALVCLGLTSDADAQVNGQGGVTASVSYELPTDRVTGAGVGTYVDIVGIGLVFTLDYQNIPKREEGAVLHGHTLGFGAGFRFSPVSLANDPRLTRYFDLYGAALFQGGVAYRKGRFGWRNSPYVAIGTEARMGNGYGIVVEHQWRNVGDGFSFGDAVIVGLSYSSVSPVRD